MLAFASGTTGFSGFAFGGWVVFCFTVSALLFSFAVSGAVSILKAFETLCDMQLWGVSFRRIPLVIDVKAQFDAVVCCLWVFGEYNDGVVCC